MELYRAYGSDGTEQLCMCRSGRYHLCTMSPNNLHVYVLYRRVRNGDNGCIDGISH